jgi:hypothetical protein
MQIKPTMRFHLILVQMATTPSAYEIFEEKGTMDNLVGNES